MFQSKAYEFWFVAGSQHLYGEEAVREVEEHANIMCRGLNDGSMRYSVKYKAVATSPDGVRKLIREANCDDACAGVITWMHTFSPAKMWIPGLAELKKPLLHFHTQFNRDIPWETIDMDFMNINQSAHGDREYGFVGTRLGLNRKVIVGHWEDAGVKKEIDRWMSAAVASIENRHIKVARFGDNMRNVAVTEGDKIEAQIQLGWSVDGYGIGDLVREIKAVSKESVNELIAEYEELYECPEDGAARESVKEQARIELGLKRFLSDGGYTAFTTTFEDLHGMKQLPGLAVQRLMAEGYGFGGEGDWKTAALVRMMKVMADGKETSFMEDYTYHFEPGNEMILGSHMLEVCPSIAETKPRIEVHPLSIGGKDDPARLVFDGMAGPAVNVSLVDMGGRFRLVINEVDAERVQHEMPNLPVARVLWKPQPSLKTSAEAWILAGGAHHTCLSYRLTAEQMLDWADMTGIEAVLINRDTKIANLRNELKWSEAAYRLYKF
ncbi:MULTISPECIES: L-arabinose isomerase [Bacillus]|uniref:L-arabinose isomerase n=1 Tax=Bacillus TaxID=1386 RepID=UPI000B0ECBC6|nr:L-arabinose isomerase [Bacillus glycinifermentans]MBU8787050.1 L-arabinose isomerase [Bacillus glycinifermentans]NUJ18056.1 L-arabinose isomerase [Bacillus glycinifermentans]